MPQPLFAAIERALDRRSFLRKLMATTGALLAGVLGIPRDTKAAHLVLCCHLCVLPGSCAPYNPANCGAQWYWTCCYNNRLRKCFECFAPPATDCTGLPCNGVICSKAEDAGPFEGECPEIQYRCM
jgi:hypothetical protein